METIPDYGEYGTYIDDRHLGEILAGVYEIAKGDGFMQKHVVEYIRLKYPSYVIGKEIDKDAIAEPVYRAYNERVGQRNHKLVRPSIVDEDILQSIDWMVRRFRNEFAYIKENKSQTRRISAILAYILERDEHFSTINELRKVRPYVPADQLMDTYDSLFCRIMLGERHPVKEIDAVFNDIREYVQVYLEKDMQRGIFYATRRLQRVIALWNSLPNRAHVELPFPLTDESEK